MRIGELARRAGVPVTTVRFYERRGLLAAARTRSGYRSFDDDAVRRVVFIRRAATLGFSIAEVRAFLAASDRRSFSNPEAEALARAKLVQIREQIASLERVGTAIGTLLRRAKAAPGGELRGPCPVIAALADEPRTPSPALRPRKARAR